jgi:TolB-like protein/tetratricopeptide (TPR) repeat protein
VSLIEELKRRNVFRVAVLYLVVSWVILQVADVLFPALDVPEWGINLILGVLILGFPLVLIFSWVYELTPEGIKREKDIDRSQSITGQTGQKINVLIVVLLIVAIGVVVADRLIPEVSTDTKAPETVQSPATAEQDSAAEEDERQETVEATQVAAGMFLNTAPKESVAVLPFINMSGDPENEYFSDGLSEELLNALAGIDGMFVAARTSSFHFKGHTGDVADMARQLRVRNILEGSVLKAGARVRITAQLIDATNGYHLWSETFDRTLEDVFAVQDEISRKVAEALKVTLLTDGEAPVRRPTENMEAYLAYLRGQQHIHGGGTEGLKQAVAAFEEAVRLDPGFAEAHAGIARAWSDQLAWGNVNRDDAIGPIRASADKAMALDSDLAVAWMAKALAIADSEPGAGRDPRVVESLERALEIEPDNVDILIEYASALQAGGRTGDALDPLERALARDPLSARLQMALAGVLTDLQRYDAARQRFLSAMELAPEHPRPPDGLADIARRQGRPGEAARLQQRVIALDPKDTFSRFLIASDYMELDDLERAGEWQKVAEGMPGREATVLASRSILAALSGDQESAVSSAEQAYATMPPGSAAPFFAAVILYRHYVSEGDFDCAIAARFGREGLPPAPTVGATLSQTKGADVAAAPYLIASRDGKEAARRYALAVLDWINADDSPGMQRFTAHAVRCYANAALRRAAEAVGACRAVLEQNQQWAFALFQIQPALDPIREAPEWQSFMADLRADRAEKLARLRASGEEPVPH